jgi:hypothetical protein
MSTQPTSDTVTDDVDARVNPAAASPCSLVNPSTAGGNGLDRPVIYWASGRADGQWRHDTHKTRLGTGTRVRYLSG